MWVEPAPSTPMLRGGARRPQSTIRLRVQSIGTDGRCGRAVVGATIEPSPRLLASALIEPGGHRHEELAGRHVALITESAPLVPGGSPVPPDRLTSFQHDVVALVERLAPGEIVTYAEVALEVGRPGAAQAVAGVLRRIPGLAWWRVVPSDGRLYCTHAPTQASLLAAEGVTVDDDRRIVLSSTRDESSLPAHERDPLTSSGE